MTRPCIFENEGGFKQEIMAKQFIQKQDDQKSSGAAFHSEVNQTEMITAPPLNLMASDGTISSQPQAPIQREISKEEVSPEEVLLQDLETGTKAAKSQVDYLLKTVKWYANRKRPLSPKVKNVANNLKHIGTTLSNNLGQVTTKLGNINDTLKWSRSIVDFAKKTLDLDVTNEKSMQDWIDSARRHGNASKFLKTMANNFLKKHASDPFSASGTAMAAARASVTMNVFSSYFQVGLAALEAGNKQVHHYINEKNKELKAIDDYAHDRHESEPTLPPLWMSQEEIQDKRARYEAEQKRIQEYRIEIQIYMEAMRLFNQHILPKKYHRKRHGFARDIKRSYKKGELKAEYREGENYLRGPGLLEPHWYQNFITTTGGSFHFPPIKNKISKEEARHEIYSFLKRKPLYDGFMDWYQAEKKNLESSLPSLIADAQKEESATKAKIFLQQKYQ